ncbi:MbtH family NRPS accessory protein [Streptomyces avermitilis]
MILATFSEVSRREQYSLWPGTIDVPPGWHVVLDSGSRPRNAENRSRGPFENDQAARRTRQVPRLSTRRSNLFRDHFVQLHEGRVKILQWSLGFDAERIDLGPDGGLLARFPAPAPVAAGDPVPRVTER